MGYCFVRIQIVLIWRNGSRFAEPHYLELVPADFFLLKIRRFIVDIYNG